MKYNAPIGAADPNDPYSDGSPGAGIEGSPVPAAALEHPMREIVKVITEAGIVPDADDLTQLYQAIQALIANNVAPDATTMVKGIVELADGGEALGGSDSTRAVTSAALASGKSIATNGYMKLPGGLIFQWGKSATIAGNVSAAVTFPVAFPTAILSAQATPEYGGTTTNCFGTVFNMSTSGMSINNLAGQSAPYYYFVIGY